MGGDLARFYRSGGGGLNTFLPGGWGIRPSKNARSSSQGGGGMVMLGID